MSDNLTTINKCFMAYMLNALHIGGFDFREKVVSPEILGKEKTRNMEYLQSQSVFLGRSHKELNYKKIIDFMDDEIKSELDNKAYFFIEKSKKYPNCKITFPEFRDVTPFETAIYTDEETLFSTRTFYGVTFGLDNSGLIFDFQACFIATEIIE